MSNLYVRKYFELSCKSVLIVHVYEALAKRGCIRSKKETIMLVEFFPEDDWKEKNDGFWPETHTEL